MYLKDKRPKHWLTFLLSLALLLQMQRVTVDSPELGPDLGG